jgi:putative two-component system response regulator
MTGGEHILIVDDDASVRRLLARILQDAGHRCMTAANVHEARAKLSEDAFALMLCDVHMPGGSGIDLVEEVRRRSPAIATLMVSGEDREEVSAQALELGVYGYVVKPFKPSELLINVANAYRRQQLEAENQAYREGLEATVAVRTKELKDAFNGLERSAEAIRESREETIRRLSRAVEYRDQETGGHIERMSRYCELIAGRLGLPEHTMLVASPMHDVGKVAVPDGVLLKPGPLTREERHTMESHAEVGRDILTGTGSALLEFAAELAWTHHEWFDGSGYPRGLEGEDIPLEGRVAAVADVFDALTSDRPYRAAFSLETAIEMMRAERGTHFDPTVLDVFLDAIDEVGAIRVRYTDAAPKAHVGGR